MSTELIERPAVEITSDQVDLIKNTVANGATKDELNLFLYDCKRRGVHPLDRLIHFTVRTDGNGKRRYTPIVGIDFMRMQAAQTGEHIGTSLPLYGGEVGKDGFHCTVVVKRLVQGLQSEFGATVYWEEFFPGEKLGFMWKKMPRVMLAKVAESHALRKGFPSELSGLYTTEEMEQSAPKDDHMNMGAALYQDFPPYQDNHGLLVGLEAATNDNVPQALIMTPVTDCPFNFAILGDQEQYRHLVGQEVTYRWGKKGKFRQIQSMVKRELAPPKPILVSPDPLPIPTKPAPPPLEPMDDWMRGTIEKVKVKTGAKGEYAILTIAEVETGTTKDVFCHKTPASCWVETFEELEAQEIMFQTETSEGKNGKVYINIKELFPADVFEQAMVEREAELMDDIEAGMGGT